jgi:Na+/H+ antiporter NhaD/arsenite permease-like protein
MLTLKLKKVVVFSILLLTSFFALSGVALASGGEGQELGHSLPLWSIIPFVGMLLSIAIFPLVNAHWWEHNMAKVSAFWSLVFFIPFLIAYGWSIGFEQFLHIVVLDYIPFIVLLFGLFSVAGGIILRGSLRGTPKVNLALLGIGTVLASWVGTTGAAMLLIRPLIRANEWRQKKTFIVVFFIFLVCNIGGSLTPVGDPPLFLGFLRGVPFFWTMNLFWPMAFNALILLAIFHLMDRYYYRKEMSLGSASTTEISTKKEPLRIDGLHNLIFLVMIVGSVILSGVLAKTSTFANLETGELYGITLYKHIVFPFTNLIQVSIILLAAFLSVKTTSKVIREDNKFTWFPIKEVATLFIGIFITMIPALAILSARGSELGLTHPAQFFWATGALSSFLDNAPTYLVFMTTAASLGAAEGIITTVGTIAPSMLLAVSCGAVFMGANTYIGNAPNFMVRSIAEENKIKMPSFFGYMGWSLIFLIPLFVLNTFIFFL